MQNDLIIISEYCTKSHIESSFINLLEDDGLIEIMEIENERYIPMSQLPELEQYARLYYDLSINVAGLDAIHHLLKRMEHLQHEVRLLQNELPFYRDIE